MEPKLCNKRRGRVPSFRFHSFGEIGYPIVPSGSFRDNVQLFLDEAGEPADCTVPSSSLWRTILNYGEPNNPVPFYTLKEEVCDSSNAFCDHCRCAGWKCHFVSKRKYHFIIPMDNGWDKPLDDNALADGGHIFHGLVHSNGYGHLLCLNGMEGGSQVLRGREIMDLWDRICTSLRVRKVTVEDVSRKKSMALPLLYGVAFGHSWFGIWGYHAHFGFEQMYTKAIETLGSLQLDRLVQKRNNLKEMQKLITYYRTISETKVVTVRDLFDLLLKIRLVSPRSKITVAAASSSAAGSSTPQKEEFVGYEKFMVANRWFEPEKMYWAAAQIVRELKKSGSNNWVKRKYLQEACQSKVTDRGLLNTALANLNNVIFDDYVVCCRKIGKANEYRIHEFGEKGSKAPELEPPKAMSSLEPGKNVFSDVVYLYENLLVGYPNSKSVDWKQQPTVFEDMDVKTTLGIRKFVKEWPLGDQMEQVLTFICCLKCDKPNFVGYLKGPPCGEIVVVPLNATVRDLKQAAEKALRDTYCIASRLKVTGFSDLMGVGDEEMLSGHVKSGAELSVNVTGIDLSTPFKYQGGPDTWKVSCKCGGEADVEETMVACLICEEWQHARCYGIDDSNERCVCYKCDSYEPEGIDSDSLEDYPLWPEKYALT